ncbi:response regulator transcription factor [Alteraurantiacibacter aquimixticola]|uniref:Response regulator transcription factor n=1 Tax=Alteraurantiacibacter aquimixticola TaxID=2489173 RepID=A0A4V4U8S5_9SPHN|nr:response regulator transcription factor [Alteraurantiacibacter aquimixticola]TIX48897.1 response regulator transcription factor [Alteraurantiacibacter aquimixticola]
MARIIIADDDEFFVDLVRAVLEPLGHVVGALPDGVDVKAVVKNKQPDLLILDCSMPGKAGIIALREVRSTPGIDVPVMMLTGRAAREDEMIAYQAGADDYLYKPVDPEKLIVHVEALLPPGLRRAG